LANGIVKWFSDKKGYGFIEKEDGGDIFVHHKILISKFKGHSGKGCPFFTPEPISKRPISKSALICPISASGSNFNPRNTTCIPVVKIFAFLDIEQTETF